MINEHDASKRAQIASTMHLWGFRAVPDGMIREIIRDVNGFLATQKMEGARQ